MARFFVSLLGFVFLAVGVGIGWFLGKPILDAAKESTDWPTTTGVVIESEVETRRSNDRDGRAETTYKAVVLYDYVVADKEYSSDRIWFGGDISTNNRAQMRNIVREYPVDSEVKVYYDPDQPEEAVLQPGAFFTSYFMVIFGSVFAVVGAIVLLVALIAMRPKKSLEQQAAEDSTFANSDRDDFDDFENREYENDGFGANHWSDDD